MFILNIIWTTDLSDQETILSPKMMACSIANELFVSGTNISLICSSETSTAALTASLLSKEISQKEDNPIYIFPYINCPYNLHYRHASKLSIKEMKFLKESITLPYFSKNYSTFNYFEAYIIPMIKKLLWTKHNLYKDYSNDSMGEYNVLIVSHPYFIEDTFGISIKKGETMTQTYTYQTYQNDTPTNISVNAPTSCHKWHKRQRVSPLTFEKYRKIFLL
jgi:hypothetical protein